MNKTVFLDRDGVINEDRDDFVKSQSEFVWLPGAVESIVKLSQSGFKVIVITNQSGIGRKIIQPGEVAKMNDYLLSTVRQAGGDIAGIYVCPHHPDDNCECRKPKPGLFLQAAAEFGLILPGSFVVGDKMSDLLAGRSIGATVFLVKTGKGMRVLKEYADKFQDLPADYIVPDLLTAVNKILVLTINNNN